MSTPAKILSSGSNVPESAVAWSAVLAGAVGAAALSLILILLGTGLGLSVISPWSSDGVSAEALGWSTILWITLVQSLASVLGGYLAGRLRTRWVTVHTNEVYFRDTAHGFLAWAVATLLMASLLSAAITTAVSTGAKVGGAVAGAAVSATAATAAAAKPEGEGKDTGVLDYYVDLAMRAPRGDAAAPASTPNSAPAPTNNPAPPDNGEIARAFTHGIAKGELSQEDVQHLGRMLAARSGVSQADAESRVTDTFNQLKTAMADASAKAKQAADEARKVSALTALWLVVSLLLGAFLASFAATFGGRLRDSSVLSNS